MRTAAEHPQAKERILKEAQRLFLKKGFAATSVDEVCEASGLSKGSFFHYFKSKDQLATAALEDFWACGRQRMSESGFFNKADPLERVFGHIDFAISFSRQMGKDLLQGGGCLLGTFSDELSQTNPKIQNQCSEKFALWAEGLKRDLDLAKEEHAPQATIDTLGLAEHFIALLEGSILLAKAKKDPAVIEHNLESFRSVLKGVFAG